MAGEDRTEQATPQRLREARKRGDIPTSPEITAAVLAVVSIYALQQQGSHVVQGLQSLVAQDLAAASTAGNLTPTSAIARIRGDLASGMLLLLPFAVTMLVGAAAIGALNTRGMLTLRSLAPSARKLHPINNLKHLFGKEALILLLKALAKILIVVVVLRGWSAQWQTLLPQLPFMGVGAATGALWQDALRIALQITAAFFIIGVADLGYRQFAWRKRMRMTKHEVKEEFKRMEGNPQVRSRMRQIARKRLRALLTSGGLRQVPSADVVITNPTHYAVAIQYRPGKMRAPRVVAKGQNLWARRIKDTARKHHIAIVENKPLAQALYKSVEVNKEIPADLYQAVAQVLAFVYRLRGMARPARRRPFSR